MRRYDTEALGVTIVGYPRGEFGIGESARLLAKCLVASHVPFEFYQVKWTVPGGMGDTSVSENLVDNPVYPIQVYCMSADQVRLIPVFHGPNFWAGRYRIGSWFWELSRFPDTWRDAFAQVDEVWVASRFVQEAIASATTKPVIHIPLAVEFSVSRPYSRAEFGLPADRFLFLFVFDLNSYAARKNPRACIDAFVKAFGDQPNLPVGLVIKTMHGHAYGDAFRELREAAARDARIQLIDRVFARDQLYGLQSVCDCFVSLHRAEGFGLGIAEMMLLGKPVIVTGYSGNMDFTTPDNACLVRYQLVPVQPEEYPEGEGQVWADPDKDHAASYMREIASNSELRTRLGRAGSEFIQRNYSVESVSGQILARLKAIHNPAKHRDTSDAA
jgi:glycosyltransferase involved in cell wall biosynthesis